VEECAGSAKIHLFRIVQEALTNVIKHADAVTWAFICDWPKPTEDKPAGLP
jgi:nitrate/nitrite-specific signal transduction histidine kinase